MLGGAQREAVALDEEREPPGRAGEHLVHFQPPAVHIDHYPAGRLAGPHQGRLPAIAGGLDVVVLLLRQLGQAVGLGGGLG